MAVSFIGGGIWSTRVQRSKYNCIVVALQGVRVILMLFIVIYEYWCLTRFPYQMMY
jgi:hypothetical protein